MREVSVQLKFNLVLFLIILLTGCKKEVETTPFSGCYLTSVFDGHYTTRHEYKDNKIIKSKKYLGDDYIEVVDYEYDHRIIKVKKDRSMEFHEDYENIVVHVDVNNRVEREIREIVSNFRHEFKTTYFNYDVRGYLNNSIEDLWITDSDDSHDIKTHIIRSSEYSYPSKDITEVSVKYSHTIHYPDSVSALYEEVNTRHIQYNTDLHYNEGIINNVPYNYGKLDFPLIKSDQGGEYKYYLDDENNIIQKTEIGLSYPYSEYYFYECY